MNFPITTDVGLSFIIKEKTKLKSRLRHEKITSIGVMSPSRTFLKSMANRRNLPKAATFTISDE